MTLQYFMRWLCTADLPSGISVLAPHSATLYSTEGLQRNIFLWLGLGARDRALSTPSQVPKLLTAAFPSAFVRHPSVPCDSRSISRLPQPRLSRRKGQRGYGQRLFVGGLFGAGRAHAIRAGRFSLKFQAFFAKGDHAASVRTGADDAGVRPSGSRYTLVPS
jgi:hypothetical protein